jgi:hypothetical protein
MSPDIVNQKKRYVVKKSTKKAASKQFKKQEPVPKLIDCALKRMVFGQALKYGDPLSLVE